MAKKSVTTSRGNKIDMQFLRESNTNAAAITNKSRTTETKTSTSGSPKTFFVPKTTAARFLNATSPKRDVFKDITVVEDSTEDISPIEDDEDTSEAEQSPVETTEKTKHKPSKARE